jgi:O-antigen/teichoic acid export membrane protein
MLRNGFISLTGALIRLGTAVIMIPLLIRLIGIEEYGLWTLVGTTISIAALAEAGLSISTTVFLSRDLAGNDSSALSETLSISISSMLILASAIALTLLLGASVIVAFFPKLTAEERIAAMAAIRIGGIVVWARLMQQVFFGPIQALQRYGIFSILITLQFVATNGVLLLIANWGGKTVDLTKGLAGISVLFFFGTSLISLLLLRDRQLHFRFRQAKFREIGSYSLLTWISSLGGQFFSQGDRVIVGYILGTSVLGIYGAITTITSQITALTALTLSPMLPLLSGLWADKRKDFTKFCYLVKRSTALNAFIALGFGSIVFVLSPYILGLVLPTPLNDEIFIAFRTATLIYSIYLLNGTGYYLLFAIGRVRANLAINFASGILALILVAVGAARYGLIGAVLGNVGYVTSLLFVYWGFHCIGLPLRSWLKWNAWPFGWFASVVVLNIWLGDRSELNIMIYAVQAMALMSWFAYTERALLIPVWRRIHY